MIALALAWASPALAESTPSTLTVAAELHTPAVAPFVGALFSPDNALAGAAANYALESNGGAANSAFEIPTTATNSWFLYGEGAYDPDAFGQSSSSVEHLMTAQSGQASVTGCSESACTGGNDHDLNVNSQASQFPGHIGVQAKHGAIQFWYGASAGAFSVTTAGSGYNDGVWPWAATVASGSCTVVPSGTVVVSGGAFTATNAKALNPGFCQQGTTFTVSVPSQAGSGSGTAALTLASADYGGTGIVPSRQASISAGSWASTAATRSAARRSTIISSRPTTRRPASG